MKLSFMLLIGLTASAPLAAGPDDGSCSATAARETTRDIVETAVAAGSFKTLAAALQAGDLVEALQGKGPFTVFAPTDEAFAKLPEGTLANLLKPENKPILAAILTHHVVPGTLRAAEVVKRGSLTTLNGQRFDIGVSEDGVSAGGARILKTDVSCSNGVIHVIDRVILPSTDDIVATAVEAGSFNTLAAALKAAGLVEALKGEGPFTVFAPTDEAFAALPEGTVENLLKPENKAQLGAVLKFHVVPGRIFSETAAKGATVTTLQGDALTTSKSEHGVFVNGAKVLQADIQATNGVIHVIDSVLLPH